MIIYYLLEFLSAVARNLPASITYTIASGAGDLAYCFWERGRRNMTKSIAAVLCQNVDSPEVRKNARHGLRNYYKFIGDMLRYAHPKKEFFERDLDLIGVENIEKALAERKGVIIVGLHMGNLDLGVRALSHAGYAVSAIVQNFESGGIDRFVQRARAYSGVKLISTTDSLFQVLNVLKRNEAIALMIDGRVYEKGVLVKLGNKNIMVPSGMAAMSLRTGAKIIPCCLIRSSNTKFHGIISKPIQFKPIGDLVEDTRNLTQYTVDVLGEMARIFADQWYIFHDLIKDDVPSQYQVDGKTEEVNHVN